MRLLFAMFAGVATLAAGPVLSQDAAKPQPPAGATDGAEQAVMHEHCKAMMGARMEGRAPHQHSQEKLGHAMGAAKKPPSEAEMKKMHEQCMARMAADKAAPSAK